MMLPVLHAIILGLIQACTEFLPISSSAHLLVVPWLLGWRHQGLFFDVALHYGTTLAVLFYFRREWKAMVVPLFKSVERRTEDDAGSLYRLATLAVATLPAVTVGLSLRNQIESNLRRPSIAAACLVVFGLLLVVADRWGRREKQLKHFRIVDGLWVGLAQSLALVPGVSRSGITITAGRILGFDRDDAARFSFLLSTPLILGATLLETYRYFISPIGSRPDWLVVGVGAVVSAMGGIVCIHLFLRYLRRGGFMPFAVYRILLAILIVSQL